MICMRLKRRKQSCVFLRKTANFKQNMKIRLAGEKQKSGILIHYAGLRTYEINDDRSA